MVPLIETLFDTIPVIVCVIARISVRVPVAVTDEDAVTVEVEVREPLLLPLIVTLAEFVLVVVELCVIVRLARGLIVTSGLPVITGDNVVVFEL